MLGKLTTQIAWLSKNTFYILNGGLRLLSAVEG